MPYSSGPNIAARPNLVFEYDTGDVANSYIGEPTTNLVNPSWTAWSVDGSGQGNIGTRTIISPYYCQIVDNTANTRQYIYVEGISASTTYTFSVQYRSIAGAPTLRFQIQAYNGGSYISTMSFATTAQLGIVNNDSWQTAYITLTTPANTNRILWFMQDGDDYVAYTHAFELKNPQVEQKSHPTPFVVGTRSNTQGLLDVSGQNNTINLASVSFTSAAQPTFDGTDDYISIDNSNSLQVGDTFTISAWVYPTNLNARYGVFSTRRFNTTGCWQFEVGTASGGTNRIAVTGIGTWIFETSNNVISPNVWTNICFVKPGNSTQGGSLYVNGVSVPPLNTTAYSILNNSDIKVIGSGTNLGQFFPGNIANVTLYNFPLSAQEVLRNYNQLKGRFNLI